MRKCKKCEQVKPEEMFFRNSKREDGLCVQCKECMRAASSLWHQKNKSRELEYHKNYYEKNADRIKKHAKEYAIKNAEKLKTKRQSLPAEEKERRKEMNRLWRLSNPDKVHAQQLRANIKQRSTAKVRVARAISNGMNKSLKRKTKGGQHWEGLVDYNSEDLKKHLERQFKEGMTWENYGKVWEIDHKIPVKVFNYENTTDIDFGRCWSLKNLQPLWKSDNKKKQAKIIKPFQPSLIISISAVVTASDTPATAPTLLSPS
ncbi:MAG: hypothetical protein WC332_00820 [Clostridia bacterium]|jgi:hypothetical protein